MQVLAQELSLVQDTGSWRKVFVMLQRKPMISHFVELRKFLQKFLILFAFKAWFGSTQLPVDLYSANAVPCNGLMPVCVLFGYYIESRIIIELYILDAWLTATQLPLTGL